MDEKKLKRQGRQFIRLLEAKKDYPVKDCDLSAIIDRSVYSRIIALKIDPKYRENREADWLKEWQEPEKLKKAVAHWNKCADEFLAQNPSEPEQSTMSPLRSALSSLANMVTTPQRDQQTTAEENERDTYQQGSESNPIPVASKSPDQHGSDSNPIPVASKSPDQHGSDSNPIPVVSERPDPESPSPSHRKGKGKQPVGSARDNQGDDSQNSNQENSGGSSKSNENQNPDQQGSGRKIKSESQNPDPESPSPSHRKAKEKQPAGSLGGGPGDDRQSIQDEDNQEFVDAQTIQIKEEWPSHFFPKKEYVPPGIMTSEDWEYWFTHEAPTLSDDEVRAFIDKKGEELLKLYLQSGGPSGGGGGGPSGGGGGGPSGGGGGGPSGGGGGGGRTGGGGGGSRTGGGVGGSRTGGGVGGSRTGGGGGGSPTGGGGGGSPTGGGGGGSPTGGGGGGGPTGGGGGGSPTGGGGGGPSGGGGGGPTGGGGGGRTGGGGGGSPTGGIPSAYKLPGASFNPFQWEVTNPPNANGYMSRPPDLDRGIENDPIPAPSCFPLLWFKVPDPDRPKLSKWSLLRGKVRKNSYAFSMPDDERSKLVIVKPDLVPSVRESYERYGERIPEVPYGTKQDLLEIRDFFGNLPQEVAYARATGKNAGDTDLVWVPKNSEDKWHPLSDVKKYCNARKVQEYIDSLGRPRWNCSDKQLGLQTSLKEPGKPANAPWTQEEPLFGKQKSHPKYGKPVNDQWGAQTGQDGTVQDEWLKYLMGMGMNPWGGKGMPPMGIGMPWGNGMPPMGNGMPPMGNGMPPMGNGMPPMGNGTPPMGNGMPPMSSGMPPMSSGMPPMSSGMPGAGGMPPGKLNRKSKPPTYDWRSQLTGMGPQMGNWGNFH